MLWRWVLFSSGRMVASSAAHRRSSILFPWCTFERGGVLDGQRVSVAQLLALLCLHIPSCGGLVALRQWSPGQTMKASSFFFRAR